MHYVRSAYTEIASGSVPGSRRERVLRNADFSALRSHGVPDLRQFFVRVQNDARKAPPLAPALQMPVFFFLGRRDRFASFRKAYTDRMATIG